MPAIWLAATHPERVSSLVPVNGTARLGGAENYPVGLHHETVVEMLSRIESPAEDGVPQDIAAFAPSLAHRVGFREWWSRAARRVASPATALAFSGVVFAADVRSWLPHGAPESRH